MKILTGVIVSLKMQKTATVEVTRLVAHPLYKKRMKRTRRYQVHAEGAHTVGETVNFIPCRPMSKTKKWRIYNPKAESASVKNQEVVAATKVNVKAAAKKEPKAKSVKTTKPKATIKK